ncbi:acyltransferase [Phytoactinopolyspora alkaliphila]|uniref:Acyltransferase n=1 Tax=Phytoactinopolyspora alkaliphila TaxID=1783498 RepID=A0A6N9YRW6_9ACTN|nr:acyltransferase [Phytoactinopolyspora alkaliphila]NED97773.1 acyltransferase [Phytoactinopolyspora alkaliphila]
MSLTRGVQQAAEKTPDDRNRHVDLLRALAISVVVAGHWTAVVVTTDDGVEGSNALSQLSWSHPVTWALQVMPIFFLVGGFANGASLGSHHRSGGDAAGWLLNRSARLLRPTTFFLVAVTAAGFTARAFGVDPDLVAMGIWAASIPLWFLAAYLSLVFLAPLLYAVHRRYGLAFPAAVAAVVLLLDVARLGYGVPLIGSANFLLVWLIFHQLGFSWQDGSLRPRPAYAAAAGAAGLGLLVWLTAFGPYPVSMVGVPGEELQNTSPPSFALVLLGLIQTAVALALRGPANRLLQRGRPWTAVVAVNAVILTVFLWHMAAAVATAVVLYGTGVMPEPDVDSGAWLLLRIPWLAACAVVLAALVTATSRLEVRSGGGPGRGHAVGDAVLAGGFELTAAAWRVITTLGLVSVVAGLLSIAMADRDYEDVTGFPLWALAAYLTGAGLLRLARIRQAGLTRPNGAGRRAGTGTGRRRPGPPD